MFEFTIEHKYCGMRKVITGESVADAFKKNGLDYSVWLIVETNLF